MDPFRPLVIDNRPAQAVFMDSNPLTDGMANFASSLINAPMAADQIRRKRAADEMAQLWKVREFDQQERKLNADQERQAAADALDRLWKTAQMNNLEADNQRQTMGMLGTGLDNAAGRGLEALKLLFSQGRGAAAGKQAKIEWAEDEQGVKRPYIYGEDGKLHPVPMEQPPAPPAEPEGPGFLERIAALFGGGPSKPDELGSPAPAPVMETLEPPKADPNALMLTPDMRPGGAMRGGSYRLPGSPAASPAQVPPEAPKVTKSLTADQVNAYAAKHGISYADAVGFLKSQGY